jgi:hypothetical protein
MNSTNREHRRTMSFDMSRACGLALAGALVVAGGCEVTNPGPVNDDNLNQTSVHQAFVNGSQQKVIEAINGVAMAGGYAARELMPGGATGISGTGHDPIVQAGQFPSTHENTYWGRAQQARWIAEEAIRRFSGGDAGTVNPQVLQQAHLWAGYSNRVLGENFCDAVFDGGPKQANIEYFKRAEKSFTDAIAGPAGNFRTAAYAGRAAARVWLKDWTGAVADANQVPLDFNFVADAQGPSLDTHNTVYYSMGIFPWKSTSVWRSWVFDYYATTGDPRVTYGSDPAHPVTSGSLSGYGAVPFFFQRKYKTLNDDYRLSSGREMVLVRAEALLNAGDWQGAMTLMNNNRVRYISERTGRALDPWVATGITDAWTFLKRERSIELWIEGRRLGDIRRWAENNTPGVLDWPNYEAISVLFRTYPPSKCFPIPDTEINTNTNLSGE